MFGRYYLYIYDKLSKEIKDITDEIQGELQYIDEGTSTVVNNRVINTGYDGT